MFVYSAEAGLTLDEVPHLIDEASTNPDAFKTIHDAAEQGDKFAQNGLGLLYDTGHGVPRDTYQAIAWYRKAAEQGLADAQYNLGAMYESNAPQDYTQAFLWFSKAAEHGLSYAQYKIGSMYKSGKGVTQNYTEAVRWLCKATEQGVDDAKFELGFMFENGQGVEQSYIAAYGLYNLIATDNQMGNNQVQYISKKMNLQEIDSGNALTNELRKQGNILISLDAFLARRSK